MIWKPSVHLIALLLTTILAGILAYVAWRRRGLPGGTYLALLMLAVADWSFFSALEAAAVSVSAKVFWSKVQYLGIYSVPVLFLMLALEYSHQERWLTRRNLVLLWIVPVLTVALAATNEWHGLIWSGFTPDPVPGANLLIYHHGPAFWIATLYAYLAFLSATVLLVWAAYRFPHLYRRQVWALILSALFPWVGNIIYLSGLTPLPGLDLTPLAFALTGLVLAWSLYRYQFLDLLPVARGRLVDTMSDAVIVVDNQGRVADLNPAAQAIIGIPSRSAIGKPASQILRPWPYLSQRFQSQSKTPTELRTIPDESGRWYDLRISPLQDLPGQPTGWLVVLHDITERKQVEADLSRRATDLQTVAEISVTVATSLDALQLLQSLVDLTQSRFDLYHAQIYLLNEDGDTLVLTVGSGEVGQQMIAQGTHIPLTTEPSLVAQAARYRQSVIVNDVQADPGFLPHPLLLDTRSETAVPMIAGDMLLGVLDVQDDAVGRFTQQDADILLTLTAQVAVALQNARNFNRLELLLDQRNKELTLFNEFGHKREGAPTIPEMLAWFAGRIPGAMSAPEICHAAVVFAGQVYGVAAAVDAPYQISEDIFVSDQQVGRLHVACEEPREFLPAERNLLRNVAQRLQNYIIEGMLRERQAQLSEAMRLARMGSYELDLVEQIVTLSDEFYELVGTTADAEGGYRLPVSDMLQKFVHPLDAPGLTAEFDAFPTSPEAHFFEIGYRFLRGGEIRHMLGRGRLLRDEQGRAVQLIGTVQDITEQVQAEAEIARLATVIEQASETIIITDTEGKIIYANPHFEISTGYPVAEAMGKNPNLLGSGSLAPDFFKDLWQAITAGEAWQGTFINKRKDGSLYHEAATIFPIKDSAGQISNYAAVMRDITAQVQAEATLRAYARRQELLNDITRAAIEQIEFHDMLQILADRLGELFEADGCYITLWDNAQGRVIPGAAYGPLRDRYTSAELPAPSEPTVTEAVLRTGHPLAIEDVYDSPHLSLRLAEQFPTRSMLGLPLTAGGLNLGAALISFEEHHAFTQDEITLGEQVARQLALAVMKVWLLDAEREQRQLAETLREVGATLSASLDTDTVLDRILELMAQVVPYDAASILAIEAGHTHLLRARGYEQSGPDSHEEISNLALEIDTTPNLRRLVQTAQPLTIPDTWAEPDWVKVAATSVFRSWIGAPIIFEDQVIAVFSLDKREVDFYAPRHTQRLAAFASQAALALKNAQLFAQVQRLAITDSLTGVYNRRHFFTLAEQEYKRVHRYDHPFSILMLDLDHFKHINDTYGHRIGDQVLITVSQMIQGALRSVDVFARYGGEEFVIMLPETGLERARNTAERLRRLVAETPIATEHATFSVTISLGVSSLEADESSIDALPGSVDILIDHADQALYLSKQSGRNRVSVYQP